MGCAQKGSLSQGPKWRLIRRRNLLLIQKPAQGPQIVRPLQNAFPIRGNYFWIILGGRGEDHLYSSFRLPVARPPTDQRTPRPDLGNRNSGPPGKHYKGKEAEPVATLEELSLGWGQVKTGPGRVLSALGGGVL